MHPEAVSTRQQGAQTAPRKDLNDKNSAVAAGHYFSVSVRSMWALEVDHHLKLWQQYISLTEVSPGSRPRPLLPSLAILAAPAAKNAETSVNWQCPWWGGV